MNKERTEYDPSISTKTPTILSWSNILTDNPQTGGAILKGDLSEAVDCGQKVGAGYVEIRTQGLFKNLLMAKEARAQGRKR